MSDNLQSNADAFVADEALVAYVDGELDERERLAVEERLSNDADYRERLVQLERAWDCLDELPQQTVDEAFTRSTVEMVALAAEEEIAQRQQRLPVVRRTRWAIAVGVLLATLGGSWLIAAALWPNPNDVLVRDLNVLRNLDVYLEVDDVAFLRQLDQARLFAADSAPLNAEEDSGSGPQANFFAASAGDAQRREWIQSRTPQQQAQLQAAQRRFDMLTPAQQRQLRQLDRAIAADAKAEQLRETLEQYYSWVKQLSPGQRNDLMALEHDERVREIRKLLTAQQRQLDRQLSMEDRKALLKWLSEFLASRRDEVLAGIPQERREAFMRRFREESEQQQGWMLMMIGLGRFRAGETEHLPEINEPEIRDLASKLSDSARRRLIEAGSLDEQRALMRAWVDSSIRAMFAHRYRGSRSLPQVSEKDLEDFFATGITSQQRAYLLSQPTPDEMQRELRRLYFQSRGPSDGPRGDGPPRGFGPPPGHDPSDRGDDRGRFPGRFRSRDDRPPRGEGGRGGRGNGRPPSDAPERADAAPTR